MKGQNLRLMIGNPAKCIAAATSCNVNLQARTEDASDKDTTDDWDKVEVTGKSWSASAECKFKMSDSSATTAKDVIALLGTEVALKFNPVKGDQNRTADGAAILSGNALITDLQITSTNRQTVTASVQFTGNGPLS